MRSLLLMVLGTALVAPGLAEAQTGACGMATLQDVEVLTRLVPQPTITTARGTRGKRGAPEWFGYTTPGARLSTRYLVTILLNDVTYTGESSGDAFWNFNPTTLVINDTVHACVAKDSLRLARPDGKDYKVRIVRAVRTRP